MFSINNLFNNANMQCINQLGQYRVFEHQKNMQFLHTTQKLHIFLQR